MMNETKIYFSKFQTYLYDFADLVADKVYDKMPYRAWRILSKPRYEGTYVHLMEGEDGSGVVVSFEGESERHAFIFGDNSFGDFLRDNVLKTLTIPKEKTPMSYRRPPWEAEEELRELEKIYNHSSWFDKEDALTNKPWDPFFEERPSIPAPVAPPPVTKKKNNTETEKENSNMKGFNFDFGPVNSNVARMSIYGLAVKNKSGTWVSYDAKNEEIMDVDVFNFDGAKFLYKMPVAIKDVAIGDVVVHMNVPMFVVGKSDDGKAVFAVDPMVGERKEIMLTKSPFGFNFVTKVVNLLGNLNAGADASNPFGNLGMMLMMSESGTDMKDMLPLMLMANGGNLDMSNPLLLMALMSDGKMGDMWPFLFMLNGNTTAQHECHCGGNCGDNQ